MANIYKANLLFYCVLKLLNVHRVLYSLFMPYITFEKYFFKGLCLYFLQCLPENRNENIVLEVECLCAGKIKTSLAPVFLQTTEIMSGTMVREHRAG